MTVKFLHCVLVNHESLITLQAFSFIWDLFLIAYIAYIAFIIAGQYDDFIQVFNHVILMKESHDLFPSFTDILARWQPEELKYTVDVHLCFGLAKSSSFLPPISLLNGLDHTLFEIL